jgi:hypothetical protein
MYTKHSIGKPSVLTFLVMLLLIGLVANDTGEDMTIEDLPRQDPDECDTDYKLLTGDDQGTNGSNFFRTKAKTINSMK